MEEIDRLLDDTYTIEGMLSMVIKRGRKLVFLLQM